MDLPLDPTPVLVETASRLPPGRALDLACGAGRNALWLAQRGWNVVAVDNSPTAIETLRLRALQLGVAVETRIADLDKASYTIEPAHWDLIALCYYLQRNLFEPCKRGLVPGGVMIAVALLVEPGKENSPFRLQPGELRSYFEGWEISHYREGRDAWHHAVAEVVARSPGDTC
jgi:tellurite methyltransferase